MTQVSKVLKRLLACEALFFFKWRHSQALSALETEGRLFGNE
jgi:hypothetical protein